MVDFLSQEPEDSKSDYTKELQYQLKLMSDSFQNIRWFDNLKQIIIAQIFKEQSKKPALDVCSQIHRNWAHPHGSTDTREETLAGQVGTGNSLK